MPSFEQSPESAERPASSEQKISPTVEQLLKAVEGIQSLPSNEKFPYLLRIIGSVSERKDLSVVESEKILSRIEQAYSNEKGMARKIGDPLDAQLKVLDERLKQVKAVKGVDQLEEQRRKLQAGY